MDISTIYSPVVDEIFYNLTDGLVILDAEGRIKRVNKKTEMLLGYTQNEMTALYFREIIEKFINKNHDRNELFSAWELVKGGKKIIKSLKLVHKDGRYVAAKIKTIPLVDTDGKFMGAALLISNQREELLFNITRLVNSSLSLQEVLKNTEKAVINHLGLASNTIFLFNDEKTALRMFVCSVFPEEDLGKVVFKKGEGIAGMVAETGKPYYIENFRTEPRVSEYAHKHHKNSSSMVFPLICKNETLGVITFDADQVRTFSQDELALFETISHQVAIAIYNSRLFEKLKHLSNTDALTGLNNYRYFQTRLDDEIRRVRQTKGNMALLLLDTDYFKNYNDAFGHQAGDELLKKVAKTIQNNVRSFDIVARYGGEEFVIILLDCTKQESIKIAQRIKDALQDIITASIGIAFYEPCMCGKELLEHADRALYLAKNKGRNRIEVWE